MFSFLKKSGTDKKADIAADTAAAPSWRERLFKGLAKTRAQWGGKLKTIFSRGKVDDELLEELETLLLTSDCGIEATQHLLDALKKAANATSWIRRRPFRKPCTMPCSTRCCRLRSRLMCLPTNPLSS